MTREDPGLDLEALRELRARRSGAASPERMRPLLERVEEHLERHDGYLAFSGGKDSLVVLDLARQVDPAVPVYFFDSGLEFPETRTHIAELEQAWGLNLTLVPAEPSALEIIAESGIWDHDAAPGPQLDLGWALIDAPARTAHHLEGEGELWGVRSNESNARRMMYARAITRELEHSCHGCCPPAPPRRRVHYATHGGMVRRQDGTVAYGPIWDWSTEQVWDYIAARALPVNPVYARLRELGAPETSLRVSTVLSTTGLEQGRVTWLRRGWPDLFEELAARLPRLRELV